MTKPIQSSEGATQPILGGGPAVPALPPGMPDKAPKPGAKGSEAPAAEYDLRIPWSLVTDARLSWAARALGGQIHMLARANGSCFAHYPWFASKLGMHRDQVGRLIRKLEVCGYVKVDRTTRRIGWLGAPDKSSGADRKAAKPPSELSGGNRQTVGGKQTICLEGTDDLSGPSGCIDLIKGLRTKTDIEAEEPSIAVLKPFESCGGSAPCAPVVIAAPKSDAEAGTDSGTGSAPAGPKPEPKPSTESAPAESPALAPSEARFDQLLVKWHGELIAGPPIALTLAQDDGSDAALLREAHNWLRQVERATSEVLPADPNADIGRAQDRKRIWTAGDVPVRMPKPADVPFLRRIVDLTAKRRPGLADHPVFALKCALRAIYLVKAVHLSTHWRRYLGYVSIDSVLRIAGKRDPESGWTFIEEALAGWEPPAWTAEYQYTSLAVRILWAGYSATDVTWGGCDGRTDETESAFQPCLEDVANNLLAAGCTDRRMLYWAGVVVKEAHTVQDPNRQSGGDAAPHTWQSRYLPAEAIKRSLPRHTVEPQQWEYVVLPVAHIMAAIPRARATQSLEMMARARRNWVSG